MNEKLQRQQLAEEGKQRRETLISQQVLSHLGRPSNLRSVQVRWLWDDRCRVNVIVGEDEPRVAHSFFLSVDGKGAILEANPRLAQAYSVGQPAASSSQAGKAGT